VVYSATKAAHKWRRWKRLRSLHNTRSGVPARWCLNWAKARRNFYSGFLCAWKLCLWDATNGCNCFFFAGKRKRTEKTTERSPICARIHAGRFVFRIRILTAHFPNVNPTPSSPHTRPLTQTIFHFRVYITH